MRVMAESQILSVIRMWAAIAWADGELVDAEADGLRRLIRSAELGPDERAEATAMLDAKVAMPETYLTSLTPEARRGVYRAACRMAVVDHVLTNTERSMLDRVRELLAIPAEIAREIELEVPGLA